MKVEKRKKFKKYFVMKELLACDNGTFMVCYLYSTNICQNCSIVLFVIFKTFSSWKIGIIYA